MQNSDSVQVPRRGKGQNSTSTSPMAIEVTIARSEQNQHDFSVKSGFCRLLYPAVGYPGITGTAAIDVGWLRDEVRMRVEETLEAAYHGPHKVSERSGAKLFQTFSDSVAAVTDLLKGIEEVTEELELCIDCGLPCPSCCGRIRDDLEPARYADLLLITTAQCHLADNMHTVVVGDFVRCIAKVTMPSKLSQLKRAKSVERYRTLFTAYMDVRARLNAGVDIIVGATEASSKNTARA